MTDMSALIILSMVLKSKTLVAFVASYVLGVNDYYYQEVYVDFLMFTI